MDDIIMDDPLIIDALPATLTRPLIVLDGANVARTHTPPPANTLRGLLLADAYFTARGFPTLCVLPRGMERAACAGEEAAWLAAAQRTGRVLLAPVRAPGEDDVFTIGCAFEKDGYICSNDRFDDHAGPIAASAGARPEDVVAWLKRRTITFAFACDTFVPHPLIASAAARDLRPGAAAAPATGVAAAPPERGRDRHAATVTPAPVLSRTRLDNVVEGLPHAPPCGGGGSVQPPPYRLPAVAQAVLDAAISGEAKRAVMRCTGVVTLAVQQQLAAHAGGQRDDATSSSADIVRAVLSHLAQEYDDAARAVGGAAEAVPVWTPARVALLQQLLRGSR